jgi:hypothetical protein
MKNLIRSANKYADVYREREIQIKFALCVASHQCIKYAMNQTL